MTADTLASPGNSPASTHPFDVTSLIALGLMPALTLPLVIGQFDASMEA